MLFRSNGPLWLKRGDVHASVSADVQRVESAAALARGLAGFASRGIAAAAVQAHCEGDEIKFYGVAPGRFFHWYYTGTPAGRPVDPAALARLAARAAAAAGLHVYGGDAIVAPDGALTLIDLNDWPSFAPCRDEAVAAIANLLEARADAVRHHRPLAHPNQSAV